MRSLLLFFLGVPIPVHQDRCGYADGAQGGDDGQAIQFREHAVEGDQVVITADGTDQAFAAIVYPVYVQSMATQLCNDLAGRYGVVLDGQNAGHKDYLVSDSH